MSILVKLESVNPAISSHHVQTVSDSIMCDQGVELSQGEEDEGLSIPDAEERRSEKQVS